MLTVKIISPHWNETGLNLNNKMNIFLYLNAKKNWNTQNIITKNTMFGQTTSISGSSFLLRFPPPKFYWSRIFKTRFLKWWTVSIEVQSLQPILRDASLDCFRREDLCCGCDLWWWMLSLVWTGNPITWRGFVQRLSAWTRNQTGWWYIHWMRERW